ncbi:MAG TPA: UDP-3-O-(3-hydroxymyristoyl)glucosamine N-acyltransferase [Terriglobales bacterium]|nr:UDP-3-O-(3-hydroxymyristoyl)glucosamine N-acyltransferase [Terriglobales bacterium]
MRLEEIARKLGARLDACSDEQRAIDITAVVGIEAADSGHISFIVNPKYAAAARTTRAAAVLVAEDFAGLPTATTAALRIKNPYLAFAKAIELFYQAPRYSPGIHPTAVIDPSAKLGKDPHVGPYVVIGPNVTIGDDCILLAHVVIYTGATIGDRFFAHAHAVVRERCRLAHNVTLQNGAVIGADGYGFAKDDKGDWYKIVQSGVAVLEDKVEVQANACIDRASIGETRIGADTKVDNLVQVGHGSSVGKHTMLCAQVGLAGSTEVGDNVILAGQVGVAGHCRIGDQVVATAQSGIPNDVEPGKMVSGYPAVDNKQWLRSVAVFNKLPELAKAVRSARKPPSEEK